MLSLDQLIEKARAMRASDVHIVCGLPAKCRVDGNVTDLTGEVLTAADCEMLARELAGAEYETMADIGELDMARSFPDGGRTRVNLFRQQGSVSAAIRLLADHIPSLDELSLPPVVADFASYRSGIVLVTGETGSGKSTTLAALLDRINHTRNAHIITLEDPIEYVYVPDRCIVNQREIGADTRSYADGLRAILREDPDVILIGEMRDLNTIETALTAAETGHLVFATLHTNSAADAVDRMVNVFPAAQQQQIRLQLSTTLRAVLSQQLLPRRASSGRIAACEIMVVTDAIRNLIRDALVDDGLQDPAANIVGSITVIYDHHTPDLTRKIDEVEHNYPDEVVSSMHVHLDHHSCLEVIAVKGRARKVNELANCLLGIKGILYGKLTVAATEDRLEV